MDLSEENEISYVLHNITIFYEFSNNTLQNAQIGPPL